jgi:hypothetical protein
MRAEGLTLQAIGDTFNLTRERIRQLLVMSNGPTAEQVREYRRTRHEQQVEADRGALVGWLKAHPGRSLHEAQEALAWSESRLAGAMSQDAHRLAVQARDGSIYRQFSTEQTLAAIRQAWQLSRSTAEGLSYSRYQQLLDEGSISGPSAVRVVQVFESWRRATDLAGVPSGRTPNREYESKWSDGEILAMVVRYLEDPATKGTFAGWDPWRRENAPDAPSGGLLRLRLGPWSQVKALALASSAANREL